MQLIIEGLKAKLLETEQKLTLARANLATTIVGVETVTHHFIAYKDYKDRVICNYKAYLDNSNQQIALLKD